MYISGFGDEHRKFHRLELQPVRAADDLVAGVMVQGWPHVRLQTQQIPEGRWEGGGRTFISLQLKYGANLLCQTMPWWTMQ